MRKPCCNFYKAIQLDPNYAAAYGMAARAYVQRNSGGWPKDRAYEFAETERLANQSRGTGPDDAVAVVYTQDLRCPTFSVSSRTAMP